MKPLNTSPSNFLNNIIYTEMSLLDCDMTENEFELQLFDNVHFQTNTLGER